MTINTGIAAKENEIFLNIAQEMLLLSAWSFYSLLTLSLKIIALGFILRYNAIST